MGRIRASATKRESTAMDRVRVWAPKPHYVADAAAVEITLTEDEIGQLEEPYPPQALYRS
jgi:hypothetical protein